MNGSDLIFAGFTVVFWAIWSLFSKIAARKIGSTVIFWQILVYFAVVIIYSLVFFHFNGLIKGNKTGITWALIGGFFNGIGAIFFYILLSRAKVSIAVPLTSVYPALTVILGVIFLHESLTIIKILGIILAIAAVFLLSF